MNIHAPSKEIREKYARVEWRGKRWNRNGKTYIKAFSKVYGRTFVYCFEEDFAWFYEDYLIKYIKEPDILEAR